MAEILRPEEYKRVDETITEVIRKNLVWANLLQPFRITEADLEISWDEYSDMSAAKTDMFMEDMAFDNIAVGNRKTVLLPITHKEFLIRWRELQAARRAGRDLDTANVAAAAAKVAEELDKNIALGNSAFGISGIMNTPGILTVTGADFGTAPNAYETFRKARDKLIENNINPPFIAVLNPVQYGELDVLTANDNNQRKMIEGNFVDRIYYSDLVPAGEGYVIATSKQYMDRATLGGIKRKLWIDQDTQNRKGRVWGIEIPRIRVAKAICKMTGI